MCFAYVLCRTLFMFHDQIRGRSVCSSHNVVHSSVRKRLGKECGRTFKSSDGLKYHQQSSHSDQKPQFPCKHSGCESVHTKLGCRVQLSNPALSATTTVRLRLSGMRHGFKDSQQSKDSPETSSFRSKVECDFPGCKRTFRNGHGQRQHHDTIHVSVQSARPKQVKLCVGILDVRSHSRTKAP